MIPVKKVIKLRKKGLTYEKIGEIFKVSRQRIHQLIKKEEIKEALKIEKEEIELERKQIIPEKKYYCFRCQQEFKTPLPPEDAICVKCGSEKVVLQQSIENN